MPLMRQPHTTDAKRSPVPEKLLSKKCDLFVCQYVDSCIVGVSCENGMYPVCKFQLCHVCRFKDKCKKKENTLLQKEGK